MLLLYPELGTSTWSRRI